MGKQLGFPASLMVLLPYPPLLPNRFPIASLSFKKGGSPHAL